MATMATLRKQAKEMGIAASEIRSAEDVDELKALIKSHGKGNSGPARKAVAKKTVAKKTATKKAKATKASARKAAPAKSRNSGKAKRQSTTTRASSYEPKGGRNLLDGVDYSDTDGWNPRAGSAPDRIVKLLRKFKGNREKVYEALKGEISDFVKPKKADGSKWGKGEREAMLRYRIARTAWDFALKTGQHEKADNRVEYGTGGTGQGIFKRGKASKSKPAAKTPAKRGRPAGSTKSKAKAASKRGRPVGSGKKTSTAKARAAGRKAAKRK